MPVTGSTAAGVARISIVNRTALSYSVNVTDMHATALRLSTPEGIVFTVAGFRDGTMVRNDQKLFFYVTVLMIVTLSVSCLDTFK